MYSPDHAIGIPMKMNTHYVSVVRTNMDGHGGWVNVDMQESVVEFHGTQACTGKQHWGQRICRLDVLRNDIDGRLLFQRIGDEPPHNKGQQHPCLCMHGRIRVRAFTRDVVCVCVCVCVCACVGRCSAHMDAIQCVGTQTDVIPTFLVDVGIHPWPRPLEILSWVWVDVCVCMCVCMCVCVCTPIFETHEPLLQPGVYLSVQTGQSIKPRTGCNQSHPQHVSTACNVDSLCGRQHGGYTLPVCHHDEGMLKGNSIPLRNLISLCQARVEYPGCLRTHALRIIRRRS
jgi:hypothetical protein